MGRHLADHRSATTGGKVQQFLRLARVQRKIWHRSHAPVGPARLINFLRIARGRSA
ncbi:MAG: hypothetical protein HC783_14500 [Rhodobacteraceae bacterium]|nr:hypothetical protein [Paracoccaceae bacterium]